MGQRSTEEPIWHKMIGTSDAKRVKYALVWELGHKQVISQKYEWITRFSNGFRTKNVLQK